MRPVDDYPEWFRPFEMHRRQLGVSGRRMCRLCGYSSNWWSWLSGLHTPPSDWERISKRILNVFWKLEGKE